MVNSDVMMKRMNDLLYGPLLQFTWLDLIYALQSASEIIKSLSSIDVHSLCIIIIRKER